jgi:hypothetical protein
MGAPGKTLPVTTALNSATSTVEIEAIIRIVD